MGKVLKMAFVATAALLSATYAAETCAQEAQPAPRENLMKTCGDKWRAVREVETQKGVTWPQFLSTCRAQAAGAPTAPVAAQGDAAKEEPRRAESTTSSRERSRQSSAGSTGTGPLFPRDVAERHASERPALARQRTCAEQFKANKQTDANGGLKWIEKGGGYWSKCNAHLKQLRA